MDYKSKTREVLKKQILTYYTCPDHGKVSSENPCDCIVNQLAEVLYVHEQLKLEEKEKEEKEREEERKKTWKEWNEKNQVVMCVMCPKCGAHDSGECKCKSKNHYIKGSLKWGASNRIDEVNRGYTDDY